MNPPQPDAGDDDSAGDEDETVEGENLDNL